METYETTADGFDRDPPEAEPVPFSGEPAQRPSGAQTPDEDWERAGARPPAEARNDDGAARLNEAQALSDRIIRSAYRSIDDRFPDFEQLSDFADREIPLNPELIGGVLRCGHKMLLSGPSKAGKSFLLMELCAAIAAGDSWLGFSCRQGRVLYVNLEIDQPGCIRRFFSIFAAKKLDTALMRSITIWNLRGWPVNMELLTETLIGRIREGDYDAVILDPIYKLLEGDENSAGDITGFCNRIDRICERTRAAVIYAHHHSKGPQAAKRSADRASGSGVFARDPDAILDMLELNIPADVQRELPPGATAWRLEGCLREFSTFRPFNFSFVYPLHHVDTAGLLDESPAVGSAESNLMKSPKRILGEQRTSNLDEAFDACRDRNGGATVRKLAEYMQVAERSIRRYVEDRPQEYCNLNGIVFRSDGAVIQ